MRMWLVLLACVALSIALWWWSSARRADVAGLEPRAAESAQDAAGSQLDASQRAGSGREGVLVDSRDATSAVTSASIATDNVLIRSSIGLKLAWVEAERASGTWSELAMIEGRCERAALEDALHVRAGGHAAVVPVAGADEIVLEPDALLRIHAAGMRACVRAIEPQDILGERDAAGELVLRPQLRRALSFGWLSDDEWAVAVTPELQMNPERNEVGLDVFWRDERRGWVYFHPQHGAREQWNIPCELRVSGSPLHIRVLRPDGFPAGPVAVKVHRSAQGASAAWSSKFSWGFATGWPDDEFFHEVTIPARSDEVTLPFAPTARLLLFARDESSSAYGRSFFVHDGSERTLELRPPFELRGRLVSERTSEPVTRADISTEVSEDGGEPTWGWQLYGRDLVTDAQGSFLLRGPVTPILREEVALEVPPILLLKVDAPGFEPFEKRFETLRAPSLDCGVLKLVERDGDLVLAPGHGIQPAQVKWYSVLTPGDPTVQWMVRDARLESDGALAIFMVRDEKDPKLLSTMGRTGRVGRAWPTPAPECCAVHVHDEIGPRAYERDAQGRYSAVPMVQHDISFDCREVADQKPWAIGWTWRGLSAGCNQVQAANMGEVVRISLQSPASGATLTWSLMVQRDQDPGSRGGAMPIESIRAPIVLH